MKRSRTGFLVAALMALALVSLPAVASAVQLTIDADTFVNAGSANQNNGNNTTLKVSPSLTTFMKFDLTTLPDGLTAADIDKATFTFYVNTVTTQGPINIKTPVANGWLEASLTYANRPALGNPVLTSLPILAADKNNFVTVDITDIVKSWLTNNNGLAIETTFGFSTSFQLDSKENSGHDAHVDIVLAGSGGGEGATGPTGPTGANGTNGTNGVDGTNGATGATGPTGPSGADGTNGTNGYPIPGPIP